MDKKNKDKEKKSKLEETIKKSKKQNRSRVLMIEVGGNYNPNVYIDFLIVLFVNLTIIISLISFFNLAYYKNINVLFLLVFSFTAFEYIIKEVVLNFFAQLIIYSLGTIFYALYSIGFFIFDYKVPNDLFNFGTGTKFLLFVTLFSISRFFVSSYVKYQFRLRRYYKAMRDNGDEK